MNTLTRRVKASLQARGIAVHFIAQGHLARVELNGETRMATEEQFAYRGGLTEFPENLARGLAASILSKHKGRRRATLREVVVSENDTHQIAHTCVGFL